MTIVVLVLGLFVGWTETDPTRFRISIMLVLPATVTLAAPLLTAMRFKPYDVFHPLNFIALSFFFGVFGRVLFILYSDSEAAKGLLEGRSIEALIPGAILSMVGSLLLCAGFILAGPFEFRSRTFSTILEKANLRGLMLWLPVLVSVSAAATIFFLRATDFQYTGIASLSLKRKILINGVESSLGYHRLLAQDLSRVVLIFLISMWFWPYRRSFALRLAIFTFGFLAVALPFLASSRASVLIALISVCVVINRLRPIRLKTLAITFIVCVMALTAMLALRRENQRGLSASESIATLGVEPLFGNKNFACVVKLAHISSAVPDLIDYKYGQSYLGVAYAPIPRTIWEGKPPIRMGREISEKVYHRGLDLREKGGGTPPGMFAEAIINFGIYGFPIAVLFMGYGLRVLYNSLFQLSEASVAGTALYAGVLPGFCLELIAGDFTGAMIFSLSVTGLTVFLCVLSRFTVLPRQKLSPIPVS